MITVLGTWSWLIQAPDGYHVCSLLLTVGREYRKADWAALCISTGHCLSGYTLWLLRYSCFGDLVLTHSSGCAFMCYTWGSRALSNPYDEGIFVAWEFEICYNTWRIHFIVPFYCPYILALLIHYFVCLAALGSFCCHQSSWAGFLCRPYISIILSISGKFRKLRFLLATPFNVSSPAWGYFGTLYDIST